MIFGVFGTLGLILLTSILITVAVYGSSKDDQQ
jgi:hypothetical protein